MMYPQSEEQRIKLAHPYYKIMELGKDDLQAKLESWSREELIEWLCWNDRNGIYIDQKRLEEGGDILTKNQAKGTMIRQIIQSEE